MQSLFESSFYAVAFLWTPALDTNTLNHAPLGYIFAAFMMAVMAGSFLFRRLVEQGLPLSTIMTYSLAFTTFCLMVAATRREFHALFLCFVGFQLGCGVYFPTMGSIRSRILPEAHRTALMNWFFYLGVYLQRCLIAHA